MNFINLQRSKNAQVPGTPPLTQQTKVNFKKAVVPFLVRQPFFLLFFHLIQISCIFILKISGALKKQQALCIRIVHFYGSVPGPAVIAVVPTHTEEALHITVP